LTLKGQEAVKISIRARQIDKSTMCAPVIRLANSTAPAVVRAYGGYTSKTMRVLTIFHKTIVEPVISGWNHTAYKERRACLGES